METFQHLSLPAAFAAGLLEFLGVPIPGGAVLVGAGAAAGAGLISLPSTWLAALLGAFVADQIWFRIARVRGDRIIATACLISASPEACINHTHGYMRRFGPRGLLFAKLLPGVSNLATPAAAVAGISSRKFAVYSAAGSAIWAGVWLGMGALFNETLWPYVQSVLAWGPRAAAILFAVGAAFVLFKVAHARIATLRDRNRGCDCPGDLDTGSPATLHQVSGGPA
jgi:membrane protein DedA with SNARE-associated domain